MLDWWIILQKFYYKIVECCLVLKKIFEKLHRFCNFQLMKKFVECHELHLEKKVFSI